MHGNQFWWAWDLRFWRFFSFFVCLQKWSNFPFGPWTIVHGGQKIESAQKIHAVSLMQQLKVDVNCMEANFCGHGTSGFGDFAPF